MWFIFIAVLIVVAVMLVFLLMAIRLLASQAKQSLDGYFMKNLEVYEELEENLSLRTKELQGQIDGQEKKLDILQKKQARMEEMTSAVRGRKEMAGGDGILSMVQAVYRDGDFMEDYSYIRSRMRFSTESIMKNVQGRINFQEDEKTEVCQGILDKFPADTLYPDDHPSRGIPEGSTGDSALPHGGGSAGRVLKRDRPDRTGYAGVHGLSAHLCAFTWK